MNRRKFLKLTAITGASAIAGCNLYGNNRGLNATQARPNVVMIYTDDQNFEHIGCYGNKVLTPYHDQLAKDGVMFTRGYVTTSICTPSRYAALTGQFPSRCNDESFRAKNPKGSQITVGFDTHFGKNTQNLAKFMQKGGYKTGMVGKWHLSPFEIKGIDHTQYSFIHSWVQKEGGYDAYSSEIDKKLKENHRRWQEKIKEFGFDFVDRVYAANAEGFNNHSLNYHNLEWTVEGALDFIDQNKNENFFLYFAPTLHHIPHPQESLLQGDPTMTIAGRIDKIPDCMPSRKSIYDKVVKKGYDPKTAYCTWLDEGIGAILNKLKKEGLYENTIIIFCSDHQVLDKATIYEGGVRTPMIMSWKKHIKGRYVCNELAQNIDFAPTILNACGITPSEEAYFDGKDILPMLKKRKGETHKDLFFEIGWTKAVCTKKYKYIALRYPSKIQKEIEEGNLHYHCSFLRPQQHNSLLRHPNFWEPDQLYDLETDPEETTNLAYIKEYEDILADMKNRLNSYVKTFDNQPFGEFG